VAPAPAPAPAPKKAEAASPAHIIVRLPADAKLSVDGVDCPLTSETRSFDSPALQPGQRYFYTFKAEVLRDGKTRTESKRVIIAAGEKVNVEFNLPVETASR
jgi:uncharacterized protein (TIGR03000 family)